MHAKQVAVLLVAGIALAGAGFAGGMSFQNGQTPGPPGEMQGRMAGGPMAEMSDEDRAAFESMSDEERRTFAQERFGNQVPDGPMGAGGPARGGTLEGTVIDAAGDTLTLALTDGGSQTVYVDGDTVLAAVVGAAAPAEGSNVMIVAEPAADGVTTARAVIVR